jgi:hypothetical protein
MKKKIKLKKLDGGFILVAQAPRAKVELFHLAVDTDGGRVNISEPAPVGVPFGMADFGTIHGNLTANITLQFSSSPLVSRYGILQNLPIHSNIVLRDKQEMHPWLT